MDVGTWDSSGTKSRVCRAKPAIFVRPAKRAYPQLRVNGGSIDVDFNDDALYAPYTSRRAKKILQGAFFQVHP
jgi:hypothetical protein